MQSNNQRKKELKRPNIAKLPTSYELSIIVGMGELEGDSTQELKRDKGG